MRLLLTCDKFSSRRILFVISSHSDWLLKKNNAQVNVFYAQHSFVTSWLILNVRGKILRRWLANACHHFHCGPVRFFYLFVFFTTYRWPQLQASYGDLRFVSPAHGELQSVLPNSRHSHLGVRQMPQCTSLFSIWYENAIQFWSNGPPEQDPMLLVFFCFVLLLVRLQRHHVFHICMILCLSWAAAVLRTQRRLIRSGAQWLKMFWCLMSLTFHISWLKSLQFTSFAGS